MKELIILVLCFVLYVVAVEVYEAKIVDTPKTQRVQQEQSIRYCPPSTPVSENDENVTVSTGLEPD